VHTYICLFDLPPYDQRVAPALRLYQNKYDPSGVVALMQDISKILPTLRKDPARPVPDDDECKHWIDSLGPDAGYKPSEQTMREVAAMLIACLCIPRMVAIDGFAASLAERSEWFADLMDGGEELAGGRLEFTLGSGSLIATRQQIRQFLGEVPDEPKFQNLIGLLKAANSNENYTLLKTSF
jgi:hypothetical protein